MDPAEHARLLILEGKFIEAARIYKGLTQTDPLPKWHTNRALCFLRLGRFWDAVRECDKAIALDPQWGRAYTRKAESFEAVKNFGDALDTLQAGLQACPTNEMECALYDLRSRARHIENDMRSDVGPAGFIPKGTPLSIMTERMMNHAMTYEPHLLGEAPNKLTEEQHRKIMEFEAAMKPAKAAVALEHQGKVEEAIPLYESAAKRGCTIAMSALGRIYANGESKWGVDHERALFWNRKCVANGPSEGAMILHGGIDLAVAESQGSIGTAYRHGLGVQKDLVEAERWLRLGAESGSPLEMNNLASLLVSICPDSAEAVTWYQRSAAAGYARGMVNLGKHLLRGEGCQVNMLEAQMWLTKAAELGESKAYELLAELETQRGDVGAARKHMQNSARVQKAVCSDRMVGASTRFHEGQLLLAEQVAIDDAKSNQTIWYELSELGTSPLTFSEFTEIAAHDTDQFSRYHEALLSHLQVYRPPTELETKAICCFEKAGKSGESKSLLACGAFLRIKGFDERAIEKFLGAANLGEAEGWYEAGRLLATSVKILDIPKALQCFTKALQGGCNDAGEMLGRLRRWIAEHPQPCSNEAPDLETPPCSVFDALVQSKGFVEKSIASFRAQHTEEETRLFAQYLECQHAGMQGIVHTMRANHSKTGSSIHHLDTMRSYVDAHPDSYTGCSYLFGLEHFVFADHFICSGNFKEAVLPLFYGFLFDEKAISVPSVVSKSGDVSLEEPYQQFAAFAAASLRKEPDDLQIVIVNMAITQDLTKRIQLSGKALQLASDCLMPKLLLIHGCFQAFANNSPLATKYVERSLAALQADAQVSLWPYSPPRMAPYRANLRNTELLTVELEIGRTLLQDKTLEGISRAEGCIRKFLERAPGDTHRYWEAFSDLGEALLTKALMQKVPPDVEEMKRILKESEQFVDVRIPAFRERRREDFPKFMQFKAMTESFTHFSSLKPDRFKSCWGKHQSPKPVHSKCWSCSKAIQGMKKCSRCHIAEYCSPECQRLHWKLHKIECQAITQRRVALRSVDPTTTPFRDDIIGPDDSASNVGAWCGDQELDAFTISRATSLDEIDKLLVLLLQKHSDKENQWVCIEADFQNLAAEPKGRKWLKNRARKLTSSGRSNSTSAVESPAATAKSKSPSDVSKVSTLSLVSAATQQSRCFLAEALFATAGHCYIRAGDVIVGSQVLSASGRLVVVVAMMPYQDAEQDLVELRTQSATLTVTATHRVMVQRRSGPQTLRAEALKIGDEVLVGGGHVETLKETTHFKDVVAVVDLTFSPDEPVEAFHPLRPAILSKGHGGTGTRRGTRSKHAVRKATDNASIPDTEYSWV